MSKKDTNSDSIIVINGFANTEKKINILIECIKQFKKSQHEILLIAQWPISIEIQNMVDYYIYDSKDPKTPAKTTGSAWYKNSFFRYSSVSNVPRHSYAVFTVMKHAVIFAKGLGKKYIYYFDYDCWVADSDLALIDAFKDTIKKSKLFGAIHLYYQGLDTDEAAISVNHFIMDVNYFNNKIDFIKDIDIYLTIAQKSAVIERFFYNLLEPDMANFLQLAGEKSITMDITALSNSKFNLTSTDDKGEYAYEFAYDKYRNKYLVLINGTKISTIFKIMIDDILYEKKLGEMFGDYIKIESNTKRVHININDMNKDLDLNNVQATIEILNK